MPDVQTRSTEIVDFASAAQLAPEGSLGIVVGDDGALAVELARAASAASAHLLLGPAADPALDEASAGGFALHRYVDTQAVPLETHAFHQLLLLPGSLGSGVGLIPRLGELRRLLRPGAAMVLSTGPLAKGLGLDEDAGRVDLEELQRALAIVGFAIVKVHLDTPAVRLTPADQRAAFSRLGVAGALLVTVAVA